MKLLLDENIPHQLRALLVGHDCYTVEFLRWKGIKNGKLLAEAAANGFEVMISGDKGLEYEQNQASLPLPVIVLLCKDNKLKTIIAMVPDILQELSQLGGRRLIKITSRG